MAVSVVDPASHPASRTVDRAREPGRIHSGQVVASQVALVLWLATQGRGQVPVVAATGAAVAVLAVSWLRVRRRWLYQWLGLAARYLTRRRRIDAGAHPATLLGWVRPGAQVVSGECDGETAGVIEEFEACTALIELGESGELVEESATPLPRLAALLTPGVRLRLVVAGTTPAGTAGAPAASYRQLTEGRLLARRRAVLAVQALRAHSADAGELRRTLSRAVRHVRHRLPAEAGARLLPEPAVHAVLADLAHHHGGQPVRESWAAVHVGGLVQATYRLRRWPREADLAEFTARLLALPATTTTIGLTVGPHPQAATLAVRLAAPNRAGLTVAAQALRRMLDGYGAKARPCDGEQGPALAATLPVSDGHSGGQVPAESLGTLRPAIGGAGLVIGVNRHRSPVTARLFRPEPTRSLLIGGARAAQLLTLRALALNVRVVVLSTRPHAWEPFVRAVSTPSEMVAVVPPGRPVPALGVPGTALHPQLFVLDAGPVAGELPVPTAAWRTTLVVRDELTPADVDQLTGADVLMLQPLTPAEAALAAESLGLHAAADWLTRIRGDMVGVVHRRTVRWALLSTTQIEQQLLGTVVRG